MGPFVIHGHVNCFGGLCILRVKMRDEYHDLGNTFQIPHFETYSLNKILN